MNSRLVVGNDAQCVLVKLRHTGVVEGTHPSGADPEEAAPEAVITATTALAGPEAPADQERTLRNAGP